MNLKQYFTINYWLNRIVLVISVDHILRCAVPGSICSLTDILLLLFTPATYSEAAPRAVELGLRQHPPTIISYMKACQCPSSLGDLSRLGTNPDISNLYTTKNRKVTYL